MTNHLNTTVDIHIPRLNNVSINPLLRVTPWIFEGQINWKWSFLAAGMMCRA